MNKLEYLARMSSKANTRLKKRKGLTVLVEEEA